MRRFARDSDRYSVGLGTNARSRGGVDFDVPILKIVDSRGARSRDYPARDVALQAYHDEIARRLADGWQLLIDDVPIEPQPPPAITSSATVSFSFAERQ